MNREESIGWCAYWLRESIALPHGPQRQWCLDNARLALVDVKQGDEAEASRGNPSKQSPLR